MLEGLCRVVWAISVPVMGGCCDVGCVRCGGCGCCGVGPTIIASKRKYMYTYTVGGVAV